MTLPARCVAGKDTRTRIRVVRTRHVAARGAVDPDVAAAMTRGARERLGATAAAATTGVAGPDPADGQPVGTVYIAADAGRGPAVRRLELSGTRNEIRRAAATECLRFLLATLGEESM